MKKRPKHYFCDLFMMNYYYFIEWPHAEFAAYANKNYGTNIKTLGCGKTLNLELTKGFGIAIWTRPKDKHNSILVHECVHAANYTLERAMVLADHVNDETQAYLTQLIFKKALE